MRKTTHHLIILNGSCERKTIRNTSNHSHENHVCSSSFLDPVEQSAGQGNSWQKHSPRWRGSHLRSRIQTTRDWLPLLAPIGSRRLSPWLTATPDRKPVTHARLGSFMPRSKETKGLSVNYSQSQLDHFPSTIPTEKSILFWTLGRKWSASLHLVNSLAMIKGWCKQHARPQITLWEGNTFGCRSLTKESCAWNEGDAILFIRSLLPP